MTTTPAMWTLWEIPSYINLHRSQIVNKLTIFRYRSEGNMPSKENSLLNVFFIWYLDSYILKL